MMQEEKSSKVKKGSLAVRVGLEGEAGGDGFRRFVIPISYLYHPLFKNLLEAAQEVYGFHSSGPLKLPCSVDDFLHLLWLIEREPHHSCASSSSRKHHSNLINHRRCQQHQTSLYSC